MCFLSPLLKKKKCCVYLSEVKSYKEIGAGWERMSGERIHSANDHPELGPAQVYACSLEFHPGLLLGCRNPDPQAIFPFFPRCIWKVVYQGDKNNAYMEYHHCREQLNSLCHNPTAPLPRLSLPILQRNQNAEIISDVHGGELRSQVLGNVALDSYCFHMFIWHDKTQMQSREAFVSNNKSFFLENVKG